MIEDEEKVKDNLRRLFFVSTFLFVSFHISLSSSCILLANLLCGFLAFLNHIHISSHIYKELGRWPKHRSEKSPVTWRLSACIYGLVPGTSRGFLQGSEGLCRGQALHMMVMLEKAKDTQSDSLMRFRQQINKQGLTVDFLLSGMSVFLFVCSSVLSRWLWPDASNRDKLNTKFDN